MHRLFVLSLLLIAFEQSRGQWTVEPSFGIDGVLKLELSGSDSLVDILVHDDQGYVLSHSLDLDQSSVVAISSNGQLVPSFNGGGSKWLAHPDFDHFVGRDLNMLPNGNLLVAGIGWNDSSPKVRPIILFRVDSCGMVLDYTHIQFIDDREQLNKVMVTDHRMLICGAARERFTNTYLPTTALLTHSFSLDSIFGGTGKIYVNINTGPFALKTTHATGGAIHDAMPLEDSKWLVAGSQSNGSYDQGILLRMKANGGFDSSFNQTGLVMPFDIQQDQYFDDLIQIGDTFYWAIKPHDHTPGNPAIGKLWEVNGSIEVEKIELPLFENGIITQMTYIPGFGLLALVAATDSSGATNIKLIPTNGPTPAFPLLFNGANKFIGGNVASQQDEIWIGASQLTADSSYWLVLTKLIRNSPISGIPPPSRPISLPPDPVCYDLLGRKILGNSTQTKLIYR